jgi:circadian clock protein KaiC
MPLAKARTASRKTDTASKRLPELKKAQTGIPGLDEITAGGLPAGRPTLLCGSAGCGKTLFGLHFLVRGALDYGEPGVFVAFEEREQDLIENVASLGFDLADLVDRKLLSIDHVHVDRMEIEESGEYDLEGLFLRLDAAISAVGAKRVVIDTLETIFGAFSNYAILRSELRRLFHWLKERGVTTIVTAERGDGTLTRHGLEEYVSDCVILLDHRVRDQISTRRVRVVKYRGSSHQTNEFPFLIDETGITVVPITSVSLDHPVSNERFTTGVPKLDAMLGGGGYYKGSTILVSGTAGSGKSSLCAHFAEANCEAGRRTLYISYEESPLQIERNMGEIGLRLGEWRARGLLEFLALRSTSHGFEAHLALVHKLVDRLQPSTVILDPIGTFLTAGAADDALVMLVRLIDLLKGRGITIMLSNLTHGGDALEQTRVAVSSLVDTWLLLKLLETNGERNRCLYVLKSRGMSHSNQIREFVISSAGIDLIEPYIGPEGVLTGTARTTQEARERLLSEASRAEDERQERLLQRKQELLDQRIAALRAEFAAEEAELRQDRLTADATRTAWQAERQRMSVARGSTNGTATAAEAARKATSPTPASAPRRRNGSTAHRPQRT